MDRGCGLFTVILWPHLLLDFHSLHFPSSYHNSSWMYSLFDYFQWSKWWSLKPNLVSLIKALCLGLTKSTERHHFPGITRMIFQQFMLWMRACVIFAGYCINSKAAKFYPSFIPVIYFKRLLLFVTMVVRNWRTIWKSKFPSVQMFQTCKFKLSLSVIPSFHLKVCLLAYSFWVKCNRCLC